MRRIGARAGVVLSLLGASCGSEGARTELIVQVFSDLAISTEIDGVKVAITGKTTQEHVFKLGTAGGADVYTLPLSFGLLPGPDRSLELEVGATALLGTTAGAHQEMRTSFIQGEVRLLQLFLGRACAGVDCAASETCAGGSCIPRSRPPQELPPYQHGKDAGPPDAPVGEPDAGGDGGDDVGEDDGAVDAVPQPNGAACGAAGECMSGFCVDGLCCESSCSGRCVACNVAGKEGRCFPAVAGTDPHDDCAPEAAATCGRDGTCDGAGECRKHVSGTECQPGSCNVNSNMLTRPSRCDGDGACVAGGMQTCAPFRCNDAQECHTTCADSGHCVTGKMCVGGSCGLRPAGAACTAATECESSFCVDGFCCASACGEACRQCDLPGNEGACSPIPAGAADAAGGCQGTKACDGAGTCKNAMGQACPGGGSECATSFCVDGVCCNAACDAVCRRCNAPGLLGTCSPLPQYTKDTCAGTTVCDASGTCKAANGTTCTSGMQCASGFCADGVCCNAACTESCRSCALAGSAGTCATLVNAEDPAASTPCTTTRICSSAGVCKLKNGQDCSGRIGAAGCASGFCSGTTLSAVCCNTACTAACQSCQLKGSLGTCASNCSIGMTCCVKSGKCIMSGTLCL